MGSRWGLQKVYKTSKWEVEDLGHNCGKRELILPDLHGKYIEHVQEVHYGRIIKNKCGSFVTLVPDTGYLKNIGLKEKLIYSEKPKLTV